MCKFKQYFEVFAKKENTLTTGDHTMGSKVPQLTSRGKGLGNLTIVWVVLGAVLWVPRWSLSDPSKRLLFNIMAVP